MSWKGLFLGIFTTLVGAVVTLLITYKDVILAEI